jgi:hypothetical protein
MQPFNENPAGARHANADGSGGGSTDRCHRSSYPYIHLLESSRLPRVAKRCWLDPLAVTVRSTTVVRPIAWGTVLKQPRRIGKRYLVNKTKAFRAVPAQRNYPAEKGRGCDLGWGGVGGTNITIYTPLLLKTQTITMQCPCVMILHKTKVKKPKTFPKPDDMEKVNFLLSSSLFLERSCKSPRSAMARRETPKFHIQIPLYQERKEVRPRNIHKTSKQRRVAVGRKRAGRFTRREPLLVDPVAAQMKHYHTALQAIGLGRSYYQR